MKAAPTTRVKKSFSISRESEQFIRRVRKSRKIASDSAALDQVLHEVMEAHASAARNAAASAYYDEASDEQLQEEAEWGAFGMSQLVELPK